MSHALKGRPQSPEHIRKRTLATMATRAAWSDERRAAFRQRISETNRSHLPEVRAKNAAAHRGRTPWNKGNDWHKDGGAREWRRAYMRRRREAHPTARIMDKIRASVSQCLKNGKGGRSWEALLGYSRDELLAHLARTIPDGWAWADYISGALHLDHIIPISAFKIESERDLRACWALSNLRLIPAAENLRKGAKLLERAAS